MQYIDTEVYVVWYGPGTGGSFITSLICDFVYGPSTIDFDDKGTAHRRKAICEKNWDRKGVDDQPGLCENYNICPIDPNVPLIMSGHFIPNFEELYYKFPKCKLIHISTDVSDLPNVEKNLKEKINFNSNPHYLKFLTVRIPSKYQHFILPMVDIIYNKKRTLKLLSSITKKPITQNISKIYDNYLDKQTNITTFR